MATNVRDDVALHFGRRALRGGASGPRYGAQGQIDAGTADTLAPLGVIVQATSLAPRRAQEGQQ